MVETEIVNEGFPTHQYLNIKYSRAQSDWGREVEHVKFTAADNNILLVGGWWAVVWALDYLFKDMTFPQDSSSLLCIDLVFYRLPGELYCVSLHFITNLTL